MIEVLAVPDIAVFPILLNHWPIEIARTLLRFCGDLLARSPGQIFQMILFGSPARGDATL